MNEWASHRPRWQWRQRRNLSIRKKKMINLVTEEVGLLVERADFRANAAALKVQNGLAGEVLDLLA